ncbi:MAG TPA: ferrous iron transport protein B [Flavobacteriales bacterium]
MEIKKVALIGNPNTGKSSLFNLMTGLKQHVGNFPGVTVDKKTGTMQLSAHRSVEVIDLPGTYSVFPRSRDEKVVSDIITNPHSEYFPDVFVVVVDATNLERNMLLYSQLHDMGLPLIVALSMYDLAQKNDWKIDKQALSAALGGVPVIAVNGRSGEGLEELKRAILHFKPTSSSLRFSEQAVRSLQHDEALQSADTIARYKRIKEVLAQASKKNDKRPVNEFTTRLDKVFVHPVWGYLIFLGVLLLIFQFIDSLAAFPMDWIDQGFGALSAWLAGVMPEGVFTDLITQGIVPGIGGVVIFIPQIALLFFFLSLLEETGYMSRVVFIMDKLVRPFGLNGKSVVPLMSSVACAIPGIMAARNIGSWKDRIITILVAPLMSCSARIPVYLLIIELVIPDEKIGFFNLHALVLLGLYLLGIVTALLISLVMKWIIKANEKSFLVMEMPLYKMPRWGQVFMTVLEKVRVFVFDAGKVILAISVILWALASYGPPERIDKAIAAIEQPADDSEEAQQAYEMEVNAVRLDNSYIGLLGQTIEPVIRPLGYDWKIGIALITSFAAREVFVGSMATIYSTSDNYEEDKSLLNRMKSEMNPRTGQPVYNLASGVSLLVFYAYAMQCMATLAVVKRETKSWKWPLIQLAYMGALAYIAAWIAYNIFK